MNHKEIEAKKKELIELFGVYFEGEKHLAPLAARIIATLIINGLKQGTTFDQLVTDLEASKSTICTHLNMLEAQQRITYFTKCGDRKRYYTMRPGYITRKITALLEQRKREVALRQKLIAFKEIYNNDYPDVQLDINHHKKVLGFLMDTVHFLENEKTKYQPKLN